VKEDEDDDLTNDSPIWIGGSIYTRHGRAMKYESNRCGDDFINQPYLDELIYLLEGQGLDMTVNLSVEC
jgi:hypothetical protein